MKRRQWDSKTKTRIVIEGLQSAYHQVAVVVEERPTYGPGRPSHQQPRIVKALRYGLQVTLHERSEVIARKTQETGDFVLLTHVPTAGEMAHQAGDVLRAYKEQHGIEQNFGFLKDPLMVNSLFLKKPERIEALGVVCLLALLIWRLMERSLRLHVEMTNIADARDRVFALLGRTGRGPGGDRSTRISV